MNDETSGQLTLTWRIPAYAQTNLWLESDSGTVQTEGEFGLFELPAPADVLTLRWGSGAGPALTQFRWGSDSLEWAGSVRVGGYVTALHITQLTGIDFPLAIVTVEGQPLKPAFQPYPNASQRQNVPYAAPDFFAGVDDDADEDVTTWLAGEDSALVGMAQDALLNNGQIYAFGSLAVEPQGWHKHFALPILLESVTLFTR